MACAQVMNDKDLARFRTKLCQRHLSGVCEFDGRCQYSHSRNQHQRRCPFLLLNKEPLAVLRYIPVFCEDVDGLAAPNNSDDNSVSAANITTSPYLKPGCPRGAGCPFAHSEEEVFYHPLMYKQKLCTRYHRHTSQNRLPETSGLFTINNSGGCTEYYCPFVHDPKEKRNISNLTYFLAPSFAKKLSLIIPQPLRRIPISKINTSKLSDVSFQEAPWLKRLILSDPYRDDAIRKPVTVSPISTSTAILGSPTNSFVSDFGMHGLESLELLTSEIKEGSLVLAAAFLTEADFTVSRDCTPNVWREDITYDDKDILQTRQKPYKDDSVENKTLCPTLLQHMFANHSNRSQSELQHRLPILWVTPGDVLHITKLWSDSDKSSHTPCLTSSTEHSVTIEDSWRKETPSDTFDDPLSSKHGSIRNKQRLPTFAYARCIAGKRKNKEGWFPLSFCLAVHQECYWVPMTIPEGIHRRDMHTEKNDTSSSLVSEYHDASSQAGTPLMVPKNRESPEHGKSQHAVIPDAMLSETGLSNASPLLLNYASPTLLYNPSTDVIRDCFSAPNQKLSDMCHNTVTELSDCMIEPTPMASTTLLDRTPSVIRAFTLQDLNESRREHSATALSSTMQSWQCQLNSMQERLQSVLIEELAMAITGSNVSKDRTNTTEKGSEHGERVHDTQSVMSHLCERQMLKETVQRLLAVLEQLETVTTLRIYGDHDRVHLLNLAKMLATRQPTAVQPNQPTSDFFSVSKKRMSKNADEYIDKLLPSLNSVSQRTRPCDGTLGCDPEVALLLSSTERTERLNHPYAAHPATNVGYRESSALLHEDAVPSPPSQQKVNENAQLRSSSGLQFLERKDLETPGSLFKHLSTYSTPRRGAYDDATYFESDGRKRVTKGYEKHDDGLSLTTLRYSLASASTADYMDSTDRRNYVQDSGLRKCVGDVTSSETTPFITRRREAQI